MQSTLYDRLLEIAAREHLPRKNASLQRLLQVSSGRITQIKNEGESAAIGEETMANLTRLGYSRDWIAGGKGPMLNRPSPALVAIEGGNAKDAFRIPILENHATGGSGSETLDVDVLAGSLPISREWANRNLLPLPRDVNRLRVIHAKGDSMRPTIHPGDILMVDTGHVAPDIDGIYVLRSDAQLFVKRVSREPGMAPIISSDNPAHKTVQALDGSRDIEIVGRVLYVFHGNPL